MENRFMVTEKEKGVFLFQRDQAKGFAKIYSVNTPSFSDNEKKTNR